MKPFARIADLQPLVGHELAVSDWITVDQRRIDLFAEASGDRQWIHVDADRARAGPYGQTVAHGFLTLALLAEMEATALSIGDVRMGLNYGLNRVRFPAPVPVDSRLRGRFRLLTYETLADGGVQLTVEVAVECEGSAKPVCIAESVTRRYT